VGDDIQPLQGWENRRTNTYTVTELIWGFDRRAVEYRRNIAHNKKNPDGVEQKTNHKQ